MPLPLARLFAAAVFLAPQMPVSAAQADPLPILSRAAGGDITQPGGARRERGGQTAALRASLSDGPVKNVILLIGDGMGDSEITAARNYAKGAGGFFPGLDALPITGQYTHYSLDKDTRKPDYVTDSAAAATAWATGAKTYNGAVGVDIDGKPRPNLLELAKKAGLATGNVTTAELTDATPAALGAHISWRSCYGPADMAKHCGNETLEAGGRGSIAEQMLQTRADVALGGGRAIFAQISAGGAGKGKSVISQAAALGYQTVFTAADLSKIQAANQQKPLLGLFAPGDLPVRWAGPFAVYHGNMKAEWQDWGKERADPHRGVRCGGNPDYAAGTAPSLAVMTAKAIDLLKANPNGFFLQVESASIDKQSHEANPCGQLGETVAFDEAVQAALDFARKDGRTLVIAAADHGQSVQIVENDTPVPGLTQTLLTKDGALMTLSYATGENTYQRHTGTQLRIAAYGPQAANISGLTDQTDLFYTISRALHLPQAQ